MFGRSVTVRWVCLWGAYLGFTAIAQAQLDEALTFSVDSSINQVNRYLDSIGLKQYVEATGVHREQAGPLPAAMLKLKFNTKSGLRNELYETTFEGQLGQTVFEKLFLVYSAVSGLPIHRLGAIGPGDQKCDETLVLPVKGRIIEEMSGCAAAIRHFDMERPLPTGMSKASRGAKQCRATDFFIPTLRRHFEDIGSTVSVLGNDTESAQLLVRNLRNQVLKGSDLWEKLHIFGEWHTEQLKDASKTVEITHFTLISWGYISSGSHGYPPDSWFTTSMEPVHYSALSEYTQLLGAEVQSALERTCH